MEPPLGDEPPLGRPRTRWLLVKPWENTREKEASGTRRGAPTQRGRGGETFSVSRGVETPVHRGGGRPPGLRRGRPWWWPKRRCGVPPSHCSITLNSSGSRVRLSVFEENRRQPRCTGSHPERMRPHHWSLLERTPLVLRAHFGSSRVREDLPRHVREVGRSSRPRSANCSPTPANTSLVRRSRSV